MIKKIFTLVTLFYIQISHSADFGLVANGNTCLFQGVTVKGTIEMGDAKTFEKAIELLHSKYQKNQCSSGTSYVYIDSVGGSVDEALQIGRLIRKNEFSVKIPALAKCFSSCVFILSSGVQRIADGTVGIHRYFFNELNPNLTTKQISGIREVTNQKIRNFLTEMDVSLAFFEESLGIEPESMRILSHDELRKFRLEGTDAAFNERTTAILAASYGLSSSEYRKKFSQAISACVPKDWDTRVDPTYCIDANILGISINEVKLRREKQKTLCNSKPQTESDICRRNILVHGN